MLERSRFHQHDFKLSHYRKVPLRAMLPTLRIGGLYIYGIFAEAPSARPLPTAASPFRLLGP